jgi:putative membrane protein
MPSEHRLHPASILFALAGSFKTLALPAVLLLFSSLRSAGADGDGGARWGPTRWINRWTPGDLDFENWQLWLLFFLIVPTIAALVRFFTFRIRYEGSELVIHSGLVFRNERHVPYGRIQNLDTTRTLLHRLLGVADVRIETAGGQEPEAKISVLHMSVFEDMRRRVFEGRAAAVALPVLANGPADGAQAVPVPQPPAAPHVVLHLPPRELMLLGLLDNRGFLLVAALYGAMWEMGLQALVWERLTSGLYAPGLLRTAGRQLAGGQFPPLWQIGVLAGGLIGLLLLVRLLSMAWVLVALYDFRLTRLGPDLRTEYGLTTRISATIPLARIQTLSIRDTPLQRLVGRASVHVETAGTPAGPEQGGDRRPRERLAPIVRTADVPALVRQVMAHADPSTLDWQPVHPRAFRRAVKPLLIVIGLVAIAAFGTAGWRVWPIVAAGAGIALGATWKHVRQLAWASSDDVVAVRSGWLWRSVTVAPVARIQTVSSVESPFDRRAAMAGVRVDTAGGGADQRARIQIPYLARETATALAQRLGVQAAETAFRW